VEESTHARRAAFRMLAHALRNRFYAEFRHPVLTSLNI
jgi:hypothetical protein